MTTKRMIQTIPLSWGVREGRQERLGEGDLLRGEVGEGRIGVIPFDH